MKEQKRTTTRRWLTPVARGAAGLVAGGVLAGTLSASADDTNDAVGRRVVRHDGGRRPGWGAR